MSMFDHLTSIVLTAEEPPAPAQVPLHSIDANKVLDAKINTSTLNGRLLEVTADDLEAEQSAVTFNALIDPEASNEERVLALNNMRTAKHIQNLVSMLTAYQWRFVEQAEELRSFVVSKLIDETNEPNARVRLKALELLGKVTEVALFTDRVEIKRNNLTDEDLAAEVKTRITKLLREKAEDIAADDIPAPLVKSNAQADTPTTPSTPPLSARETLFGPTPAPSE